MGGARIAPCGACCCNCVDAAGAAAPGSSQGSAGCCTADCCPGGRSGAAAGSCCPGGSAMGAAGGLMLAGAAGACRPPRLASVGGAPLSSKGSTLPATACRAAGQGVQRGGGAAAHQQSRAQHDTTWGPTALQSSRALHPSSSPQHNATGAHCNADQPLPYTPHSSSAECTARAPRRDQHHSALTSAVSAIRTSVSSCLSLAATVCCCGAGSGCGGSGGAPCCGCCMLAAAGGVPRAWGAYRITSCSSSSSSIAAGASAGTLAALPAR